jgi:hypothetical protein
MTGSLLGLDVGLSSLALRRLATDSLPPPPKVNDIDRAALSATVVLTNAFDLTDAGRDALVAAMRSGRARVAALHANPGGLADLVGVAALDEARVQVLAWALGREPDRVPEYFSLGDLVRMGRTEVVLPPALDAWGTSALSREGSLLSRFPASGSWEMLGGRAGMALVAEQVPDLTLRIAETLATLGLPARLVPSVLAMATQDVLDAYGPAYVDDWGALVAAVRRLPDARLADDIAALTSGGPLVPDDREHPDGAGR